MLYQYTSLTLTDIVAYITKANHIMKHLRQFKKKKGIVIILAAQLVDFVYIVETLILNTVKKYSKTY